MLIKALCDYDDYLRSSGSEAVVPDGFSKQAVSYEILLTPEGKVADILDIRHPEEIPLKGDKKKIKYSPVDAILPKRTEKTSIDLNTIEHRPLYIFGLNYTDGAFTTEDKTGKAKKSHKCFCEGNLEFFEDIDSDIARAYCNFIRSWVPENELQNPELIELGKDYGKSYYCFGLYGHPEIMLHEDEKFLDKYKKQLLADKEAETTDKNVAVCSILGEKQPIARLHGKIKGISGGQPSGGSLVCYNGSVFESYGKTQSFNSGVSEKAMLKYTGALNLLLSDPNHHKYISDMTVVYFAMAADDSKECGIISDYLFDCVQETDDAIAKIFDEAAQGNSFNADGLEIDEDVNFYIAGLNCFPNSSRITQQFIYRDKFGRLLQNILKHQSDLAIVSSQNKPKALWMIEKELVIPTKGKNPKKGKSAKGSDDSASSAKSTAKAPSALMSAIMMSVLSGSEYPEALLATVVRRVKTDRNEENNSFIKLNPTRAGIIKACLNRKARKNKEEEITMSLNKDNKNPAYLCGRLFAVLEKIQQDASNGKLNRTIKDSFFSSACSRPSAVMPRLVMLSQNHQKKLDNPVYLSKLIGEITDKFEGGYPSTLSIEEQGKFIIGYYHQNTDLYTKKGTENDK